MCVCAPMCVYIYLFIYCHVIEWLYMRFGLVIGFIELLQIRVYK
jgi:hypothetical protein